MQENIPYMVDLEEFLSNNEITLLRSNEKNYPTKMTIAKPKNHKISNLKETGLGFF